MIMTFEDVIWGRGSIISTLGGFVAWIAVVIFVYNLGKTAVRKSEFCFFLTVIVGTAIASFITAALSSNPEISAVLSVIFLWPIGIPFHALGELVSSNDEKSAFLLMIIPYTVIYLAGLHGIRHNNKSNK